MPIWYNGGSEGGQHFEKMEILEATLEQGKKLTSLKTYFVVISVDLPYPKSFEYRQEASSIAPAVSRCLKKFRKEVARRKIKEFRIKAYQL